jgi:hypothetical protein
VRIVLQTAAAVPVDGEVPTPVAVRESSLEPIEAYTDITEKDVFGGGVGNPPDHTRLRDDLPEVEVAGPVRREHEPLAVGRMAGWRSVPSPRVSVRDWPAYTDRTISLRLSREDAVSKTI